MIINGNVKVEEAAHIHGVQHVVAQDQLTITVELNVFVKNMDRIV